MSSLVVVSLIALGGIVLGMVIGIAVVYHASKSVGPMF